MVVFDSSYITFLVHPNPGVPDDPATKKPVPRAKEKIEFLLQGLEKIREKIVIPTPALSEVLCCSTSTASQILAELTDNYGFELAPFDVMAAVEAAIATVKAKRTAGKKGKSASSWEKVKFDRQIVAIAKAKGAETIYSNDSDIMRFATVEDIKVIAIWQLPEPPPKQSDFIEDGVE